MGTDTRVRYRVWGLIWLLVATLVAAGAARAQRHPPAHRHASRSSLIQKEFARQLALLRETPEAPAGQPWVQRIDPQYVDTRRFAKKAPWTVCFSNAGVVNAGIQPGVNPWRVVGFITMRAEVRLHPEIHRFVVTDAGGKHDNQIADIDNLLTRGYCDLLIVSPSTTGSLTPIVEKPADA